MKLIIQIPCYNEEETLPQVIKDLPKELPEVDEVEYLVIDDGSTDRTVEVANEIGVHHVVSLGMNRGYGKAFLTGMQKCIDLGADIIVNTDGDNQYKGEYVKDLIIPILEQNADIVIGTRPIDEIKEFSWIKKKLQRIGSLVTRQFSGTDVPDATSGFRAYSADAAMRLHIMSQYSHSLETIIQAGHMNMHIRNVPVGVNPKLRESRLMRSTLHYIWNSTFIILNSYVSYKPMRIFSYFALVPGLIGFLIGLRFLVYFIVAENPTGGTQSLILTAILIIIAFNLFALGIVAHLTGANRNLIHEVLYLTRTQKKPEIKNLQDKNHQ
jgi:glycosyltransferase involved in cell wall biosynthesis